MSQIITFEKIVPEGKAMGHLTDGRAIFTIGPLPGETARVSITKQRRSYAEGVLREVVESSIKRTSTVEDHCLICSPWQGVDYGYQLAIKKQMLADAYTQQHLQVPIHDFIASPSQLSYRNRLDFSVARVDEQLMLAFHARGSWDSFVGLPRGCKLGTAAMNQAALNLVKQLNDGGFDVEPATITVRQSHSSKQLLTILTTPTKNNWKEINTSALGNFLVTRPLSGSGSPGETVFQAGDNYLSDELEGVAIAYPYNAFFQSNVPVFKHALTSMAIAASSAKKIIELYSGVGSIGLPLASRGSVVHGIETVNAAVEFAERNARLNNITSYTAETIAAERINPIILHDADCIIVDPPRAGLHPNVTAWILDAKPKLLLYLSCNPVTQARDIQKLQPSYVCESLTGFDFYPGTLHLEALAILSYA